MELNFSNNYYKKRAMNCKGYSNAKTDKNAGEAFLLLIKGVKKEDLSYLCKKMQEKLRKNNIILTEEECYKITQEQLKEVSISKDFSEYLLDLAYECIEVDGRHLGDNINQIQALIQAHGLAILYIWRRQQKTWLKN